jgi:hypothetical protein
MKIFVIEPQTSMSSNIIYAVRTPVHYGDAIEHGGIIYAMDQWDGSMHCWDPAHDGKFLVHSLQHLLISLPFMTPL